MLSKTRLILITTSLPLHTTRLTPLVARVTAYSPLNLALRAFNCVSLHLNRWRSWFCRYRRRYPSFNHSVPDLHLCDAPVVVAATHLLAEALIGVTSGAQTVAVAIVAKRASPPEFQVVCAPNGPVPVRTVLVKLGPRGPCGVSRSGARPQLEEEVTRRLSCVAAIPATPGRHRIATKDLAQSVVAENQRLRVSVASTMEAGHVCGARARRSVICRRIRGAGRAVGARVVASPPLAVLRFLRQCRLDEGQACRRRPDDARADLAKAQRSRRKRTHLRLGIAGTESVSMPDCARAERWGRRDANQTVAWTRPAGAAARVLDGFAGTGGRLPSHQTRVHDGGDAEQTPAHTGWAVGHSGGAATG